MRRKIKYYRLVWLKYDLPAGLSVFLVALPLCLGIALASGAPLYAGLLSGIIGGLVVSLMSGSQLGVSGPAAGLTTLVSASIISLGNFNVFLLAVIIAGAFQILLGFLKLGSIASYFPSAVIKGMLAAIGILLIAKQIPLAIGYDKPDFWKSEFTNILTDKNVLEDIKNLQLHTTRASLLITVVSLAILFFLNRSSAKKLKIIPAPLLVVIVSVLLNILYNKFFITANFKQNNLVNIPANIFGNISFPDFSKLISVKEIWKDGILIGLLASLETLLCVEAIDKLDKHNRITPVNRELVAQGIGNMLCGFLGAIPMTAVVVRGAANVDAGARTKLSSFTHGLFLLIAVLFIPFALNQIPYAALAAILLITGFNLTKPKLYVNMWSLGFKQFLPFITTIIIILSTDLLIGVSIGLLLSAYFIIRNNFKIEYNITQTADNGVEHFVIKLNTNVTFLNKVNLQKALEQIPNGSSLIIDGSECSFIDYDILEIISSYATKAEDRNIDLTLKGINKVDTMAVY